MSALLRGPLRWIHAAPRARVAFSVLLTVTVLTAGFATAPAAAAGDDLQRAPGLVVRDDRGVQHHFSHPPQRVITLLPSLTETVCAIGECGRIVGTDRYSNWPAEVVALPKLGGIDDALIERIVALKPDVVLSAISTRAVQRIESLGIRVLAFDSDSHEQVRASLMRVATLLAAEPQARSVWAAIEVQIEQAAQRVPTALRGRAVYFEADAGPYAAGAASFVGQTLARLKLANIAPASMGAFPKLNPEFVVRAQPFVIFVEQQHAAALAQRPGWSGLQALKQGHVCAFEPAAFELLTRPGPRMGQAALTMADCLAGLAP
jgi:iron complex transport system substrate-binding protein